MDLYRLFNNTKQEWEYVISDAVPTVLPVNPDDELLADSVCIETENVGLLSGYPIVSSLTNYKIERYKQIDLRTTEIISQGFVFDSNTFSLSIGPQINWTNLKSNKATFSLMGAFPMTISTIDSNVYDLTEANVDDFWGAGFLALSYAYTSGSALKKQIFDAVDLASVDSVIDNR